MGKKWAEIARRLGNRSDNAVKNWWNGSQNRKKRSVSHHGSSSKILAHRAQPVPATRHLGSPPHLAGERRRSEEADPGRPFRGSWQDIGSGPLSSRSLRFDRGHAAELAHIRVPPPARPLDERPSPLLPYPGRDFPRRASPTSPHYPSGYHNHHGPHLPSVGPIITDHSSQSSAPHVLQPPLSAASLDAAPSLISDYNSTYSISPKTWPSPRSELPPISEMGRRPWNEIKHNDRRGSAPTLSHQLPFHTGGATTAAGGGAAGAGSDEGYSSKTMSSTSFDSKSLRPVHGPGRPASLDCHHPYGHRHSSSNPNSSTLGALEYRSDLKEPSSARDTRMTFSSLLN